MLAALTTNGARKLADVQGFKAEVMPSVRRWEPLLLPGGERWKKMMQYTAPKDAAPSKQRTANARGGEELSPSQLAMEKMDEQWGKIHRTIPNNANHLQIIRENKFGTSQVEVVNGVIKKHFQKAHTHSVEMFEARILNAQAAVESIGKPTRIPDYIRETFNTAPRGKLMATLANPYATQAPNAEDPRNPVFIERMTPALFAKKYGVHLEDPVLKPPEKAEIWAAVAQKAKLYQESGADQDAVAIYREVAAENDLKYEQVHKICHERVLFLLQGPDERSARAAAENPVPVPVGKTGSRKRVREAEAVGQNEKITNVSHRVFHATKSC